MVGPMNALSDVLLHGWEVHPTVVIGCIGLLVWYFRYGVPPAKYWIAFLAGIAILCLALISPIDALGDQYLFSAHMLQHLLLILIVPPLLILGLTPERVGVWMTVPRIYAAERFLATPWIAWTFSMFIMSIWHIPFLYNATNANKAIHITEHLMFLVTACMFWWPIFSPIYEQRLAPPKAMLYLFGAAAVSTVLGIIITFLPVGLYHPYLHPLDEMGALHLIRVTWGISAVDDERLAGLLMWVPGCSVYFAGMLMEMARWYKTKDPDKQALLDSLRPAGSVATHE
jgi:cytochrome c oxidase assembly factor CtaG